MKNLFYLFVALCFLGITGVVGILYPTSREILGLASVLITFMVGFYALVYFSVRELRK